MPASEEKKARLYHLSRAPQAYHDLRILHAAQKFQLRAICNRYDIEIDKVFPDRDIVYDLYSQIIDGQKRVNTTWDELEYVAAVLKYSGDPQRDGSVATRSHEDNKCTPRRLLYGRRQEEQNEEGPDGEGSPPLAKEGNDRQTSPDSDPGDPMDIDTPPKKRKKVTFANDLPHYSKRAFLKELWRDPQAFSYISNDLVDLEHSEGQQRRIYTYDNPDSPRKKRAALDDHYTIGPEAPLSPTKKLKTYHSTVWPEAYRCGYKELDIFLDCKSIFDITETAPIDKHASTTRARKICTASSSPLDREWKNTLPAENPEHRLTKNMSSSANSAPVAVVAAPSLTSIATKVPLYTATVPRNSSASLDRPECKASAPSFVMSTTQFSPVRAPNTRSLKDEILQLALASMKTPLLSERKARVGSAMSVETRLCREAGTGSRPVDLRYRFS